MKEFKKETINICLGLNTNPADVLELANSQVKTTLTYERQNNNLLEEIYNQWKNDFLALNNVNNTNTITELENKITNIDTLLDGFNATLKEIKKVLKDISDVSDLSDEEYISYVSLENHYINIKGITKYLNKTRKRLVKEIETLEKEIYNISDRNDIINVWLSAFYDGISEKYYNYYITKYVDEIATNTPDIIYTDILLKYCRNRVHQYIDNMSGINAMDKHTCKSVVIDNEKAHKYLNAGYNLNELYPLKNNQHIKLIYKDGVYKILTYTYAFTKNHSFETLISNNDEEGNIYYDESKISRTSNIYVNSQGDHFNLHKLLTSAKLSKREQRFIRLFSSVECIHYTNTHTVLPPFDYSIDDYKRREEEEKQYYKSRLEYCYNELKIDKDANQRKFISRLKEKFEDHHEQLETIDYVFNLEKAIPKKPYSNITGNNTIKYDLCSFTDTKIDKPIKDIPHIDLIGNKKAAYNQLEKYESERLQAINKNYTIPTPNINIARSNAMQYLIKNAKTTSEILKLWNMLP